MSIILIAQSVPGSSLITAGGPGETLSGYKGKQKAPETAVLMLYHSVSYCCCILSLISTTGQNEDTHCHSNDCIG